MEGQQFKTIIRSKPKFIDLHLRETFQYRDLIFLFTKRDFISKYTPVKRYSSGMYVKLASSVAAHLDADIMVMGEVLAVGDMKFQQKCLGKMENAANNEGRTVLYVSHNMNTIRQLCNRCVVLSHGKVIFDGDVEDGISVYMGENKQPGLVSDCLNFQKN